MDWIHCMHFLCREGIEKLPSLGLLLSASSLFIPEDCIGPVMLDEPFAAADGSDK